MHSIARLLVLGFAMLTAPVLAQDMSRSSSDPSSSLPSPDNSHSSSVLSSVSSELPPDNSRPPSSELSSLPSSELSSVPTVWVTPSHDMLQAFFDVCTDVAGGDPEAYDRAGGAGWQPGDYEDGGPYKSIFSAYRSFEGYEEVSLWSSVETYKSQRLGYCRVDFGDPNLAIDFNGFAGIAGLTGSVTDQDGYLYGTWEIADGRVMVIGDRRDGVVEIEFNVLIGPVPAAP